MLKIPDFSRTKIFVMGDVMLDRYLFGSTDRVSPEAPVPIVSISKTEERPGGAANVAMNISRLGVRTTIFGVVGDDEDANILENIHQLLKYLDYRSPTWTHFQKALSI